MKTTFEQSHRLISSTMPTRGLRKPRWDPKWTALLETREERAKNPSIPFDIHITKFLYHILLAICLEKSQQVNAIKSLCLYKRVYNNQFNAESRSSSNNYDDNNEDNNNKAFTSLKGTFTLIYTYIALSSPPLDLITQFSLLTIFIISRSSSASVLREYGIIVRIKINLRNIH